MASSVISWRRNVTKLLPMMSLFFLISFVYSILRPMKIALVVSASGSGAQIIPYIKTWGILPGAILFTILFTKLNRRFTREQVFYTMVSIFLGFFLLFMLVLFPLSETLEWSSLQNVLTPESSIGARGIVAMARHWHLSIFYILCELWSSVILSMLFWGYVNETTKISDATSYYGYFSLAGNLGAMFSGNIGEFLTLERTVRFLPHSDNVWNQSAFLILGTVMICGIAILFVFRHIETQNRITAPETVDVTPLNGAKKEDKQSFSLLESFAFVFRSPHLIYISLIVIGYNLTFNLMDVLWTDQLHLQFAGDTSGLNSYMNKMTFAKGAIASFLAIFVSSRIIRRYGWFSAAAFTPAVILITSAIFLPLVLLETSKFHTFLLGVMGTPLLTMTVFIGAMQNCITRASKYTLFDATKEMAFIPLDTAAQRKGKAAIDGIGSRVGKSSGSVIYQILFVFCPSMAAAVPYVTVIVVIAMIAWMIAIWGLSKELRQHFKKEKSGRQPSGPVNPPTPETLLIRA